MCDKRKIKHRQSYIKMCFFYWLHQGGGAHKTGLDHNLKRLSGMWLHEMWGQAVCLV